MMNKIDQILSSYREEMMETVQKWVRIPSVKGEAAEGAPFGKAAREALDTAMADCERMGFPAEIIDGYAGHADLGEGDTYEALAILAHLDVVPVGDGKIFGRGTSDDKGPAVAALYAMRAVKEAGIPLRRKVRLILGCDEECGSEDLRYYKKKVQMPRSGFSPDADYPVINIEKGGAHVQFKGALSQDGLQVISMHVGERANVVPGYASAIVKGDDETARTAVACGERMGFPVKAEAKDGRVKIETIGVNGHAAFPSHARNAIGEMLLVMQ